MAGEAAVATPTPAPCVSVVVPCHNLGVFLDEAVASVLAQTFDDVEIVVVDDGSTDPETCRLLETYRRPKTRVVRIEHRGLPGARNAGLAQTRGRYVCMLDADDVLEPEMLARSVAALDGDPSVAFVSHWLRAYGDETWEWRPVSCTLPALLDMNTVNGAALVRRAALEAIGGFDETFVDGCEDWDLWISLVERGYPGIILPEFLFRYRRRAGSMSRTMMQGDRHPRLYQRLAAKHAASYEAHLEMLLVRRARDEQHLQGQMHDLELEYASSLRPALDAALDEVKALERQAAALDAQAAQRSREAAVEARETALVAWERRLAESQHAVAEGDRWRLELASLRREHALVQEAARAAAGPLPITTSKERRVTRT